MIGRFRVAGATATLKDDGTWDHPDPQVLQTLNELFPQGEYQPGDHHRPLGVARLERAALFFRKPSTVDVPLFLQEPPPGVAT